MGIPIYTLILANSYSSINSNFFCSTISSLSTENSNGTVMRLNINEYYESLGDQLKSDRETNHAKYNSQKCVNINNGINYSPVNANVTNIHVNELKNTFSELNTTHKWPPHTILIASDTMLQNLDETRLSNNNFNVKARSFRGSLIKDMYNYLAPLLRKKPEYAVLHVSTNDSTTISSDNVLKELKHYLESSVPGITVIFSEPITRYDDNALACLRVRHL